MTADKRRAIRTMLARLGMQAKPQEVVETLESRTTRELSTLNKSTHSATRWAQNGP